jgi:hypothetical protein
VLEKVVDSWTFRIFGRRVKAGFGEPLKGVYSNEGLFIFLECTDTSML